MASFDGISDKVQMYLHAEQNEKAEHLIDSLAELDPRQLDSEWGVATNISQYMLAIIYNSIGVSYKQQGDAALHEDDTERMVMAATGAERCHEKAFDTYGMSADDVLFLPANYPSNKYLISILCELGGAKYALQKMAESRKYLLLCLRIPAVDDDTMRWHAAASDYLRLLDGKPVQIAVHAQTVAPSARHPQVLQVSGNVLEWGAYTMPRQDEYLVYLDEAATDYLQRHGYENPHALAGHVLVLTSDTTGDLNHPLLLVQVV